MASTAERVREYIDAHPAIRDGMRKGIVNLSALARRIMDETGLESEDAVLIACRRYEPDDPGETYGEAIRSLLETSRLDIRTRTVVLTVRPSWSVIEELTRIGQRHQGAHPPLHVVRGTEAVTVITDDTVADALVDGLEDRDVLDEHRDLVEVSVTSPETIEETPGLLGHLTTSLADEGINLVEVLSCYKDTIFVIEKADMTRTVEILDHLISV